MNTLADQISRTREDILRQKPKSRRRTVLVQRLLELVTRQLRQEVRGSK